MPLFRGGARHASPRRLPGNSEQPRLQSFGPHCSTFSLILHPLFCVLF